MLECPKAGRWGMAPSLWHPALGRDKQQHLSYCTPLPPSTNHVAFSYLPNSTFTGSFQVAPQHDIHHAQSSPYWPSGVSSTSANMAEPSELEQMQRLSETYNPDLPGPLVGNRLPMTDLVREYSQADPAFVLKTQSLATTHSGYRQIKGDGQCGWRSAVFGYFETLLEIGDLQLVLQEETRLQSFAELMKMAGIDYDIIVDMFDYTWDIFAALKMALTNGQKSNSVVELPMNDEIRSNSIVYHFKMMTSAYMQLYPENYEPFLDMPIADYRVARIDPSNQEIDQIGLQVMTDAVIAPAGFALDVLYLDRSTGNEVTPHEFAPKNAGAPTIRMLYRPGHYDLIYKDSQQTQQVYLQSGSALPLDLQDAEHSQLPSDYQAYFFTPSSSSTSRAIVPSASDKFDGSSTSNFHQPYSHLDDSQCLMMYPSLHPPMMYPPTSCCLSQPCSDSASTLSHSAVSSPMDPPNFANIPRHLRGSIDPNLVTKPSCDEDAGGPRIRPTKYVMEYQLTGESMPLCNTASGAAASLSTAHFRNEGFQPQIWKAEDEYSK